jgi:hypothetical protein
MVDSTRVIRATAWLLNEAAQGRGFQLTEMVSRFDLSSSETEAVLEMIDVLDRWTWNDD